MQPNKEKMKKSKEYAKEFVNIFGAKPPLETCMTAIVGYFILDVFRFEEMIKCPKDKSLKEFITEKYGEKANKLIDNWLDL